MSSFKRLRAAIAALGLASLTTACGFAPLAAPSDGFFGAERLPVSSIQISVDDKRFDYTLGRALAASVDVDPDAPLSLVVISVVTNQGLAIEQNDTVTRQNVRARSTYRLVDGLGGTVVEGALTSRTALNATTDQFATTIGEEEAVERVAEDTARQLINILRINRDRLTVPPISPADGG